MADLLSNQYEQKNKSSYTKQSQQLKSLLETNTILIENKKMICETKINTYTKQIQKITKLLEAKRLRRQQQSLKNQQEDDDDSYEDDSDQEVSLVNRLKYIEAKKKQAIEKLETINKIEEDIRKIETKQQNIQHNHLNLKQNNKHLPQMRTQRQKRPASNKPNSIICEKQQIGNKQNLQSKQCSIKKGKKIKSLIQLQNSKEKSQRSEQKQWRIIQKEDKQILKNSQKCISVRSSIYRALERSEQKENGSTLKKLQLDNMSESCAFKNIKLKQKKVSKSTNKQPTMQQQQLNNEMLMWKQFNTKNKKQCMIKIDDILKNSNLNATTPISILNSRLKTNISAQNRNANDIDGNQIISNQYTILLEEIQGIVGLLNEKKICEEEITIMNRDQNKKSNTIAFKLIYQYLLKIKQNICDINSKEYNIQSNGQKQLLRNMNMLKEQQSRITSQLLKIQEECELYCKQIEEKQSKYDNTIKEIEEIERYKGEIQNNMEAVINTYENNIKEVYHELQELFNGFMLSMSEREKKSVNEIKDGKEISSRSKSKKNEVKKPIKNKRTSESLENINTNILEMYDFIRSSVQSQKLAALQHKQTILSLQYNINALKGQEKRLQNNLNQLQEKVQSMESAASERTKEVQKITREKQKISKEIQQIEAETQQYENLSAVRRNCYNELDSKYNTLKNKKNKLQNKVKTLQIEVKQKEEKLEKLESNIERKAEHLQEINEEIIIKLRNKQELIKEIQRADSEFMEKSHHLKNAQGIIKKKQQAIKQIEKKLQQKEDRLSNLDILELNKEEIIKKLQSQIYKYNQTQKQKETILKTLESQITQIQSIINERRNAAQKLQAQIMEKQQFFKMLEQSVGEIETKIEVYLEQIKKLQTAKEELEQAIRQILQKKEQVLKFLTHKYTQLESLELQIQNIKIQLERRDNERNIQIHKVKDLEERTQSVQNELVKKENLVGQAQTKLINLLAQLQFNRDQQQNLHERISRLKQIQTKILLQISIKAYSKPAQSKQPHPELVSLLPPQTKQQIQLIMKELSEAAIMKQKYYKEKQQNRKLKLDNERLKKMYELDISTQQNVKV